MGVIKRVELARGSGSGWEYAIENVLNHEIVRVPESQIMFATVNQRKQWQRSNTSAKPADEGEKLPETIKRKLNKSALNNYLKTTIREFIRKEESEERARLQGRELPLEEGDYIRVKGDIRPEMEPFHNYYAKVLKVEPSDIGGIEARPGRQHEPRVHRTVRKFTVLLEDGTQTHIYDPEVKVYFTAEGRRTILNWRAAMFLAESFDDDPPYSVEYSFLEDHIFTRAELETIPNEQLIDLLAAILYVKGHMGLRDYERKDQKPENLPREFLIDNILAASRFNMRKNRPMTPEEVEQKRHDGHKLRKFLES
jgi:hypothetical protein